MHYINIKSLTKKCVLLSHFFSKAELLFLFYELYMHGYFVLRTKYIFVVVDSQHIDFPFRTKHCLELIALIHQ